MRAETEGMIRALSHMTTAVLLLEDAVYRADARQFYKRLTECQNDFYRHSAQARLRVERMDR